MKKGICYICCVFVLCVSTIKTTAENNMLQNGYTEEGIYYEVFDLNQYITICAINDNRNVTICVVFNGITMPPKTQAYTNTYSGKTYSGILYFQNATYRDGKTFAYYSGTLTLQK